ncbi:DUF418 domain-containing protein [Flavobacterium sp. GA093]|uniref:DUF418 domain-containing protein n=1 Tax=Flavobacterium hydrocarbonoxydans TaxID=2683249 RepID=A0A6I4NVU0_9FLAO|nr:DUF418 domain-containing protein [Flavobacterium hydrocarbonoxydans]MWB96575.1 DUF418 domain-containing protein [Flavobacterium hydrocarbonoxydans]
MTTSYQPIEKSKRTAIVDILRGWALLGVVIGNYIDFIYIGLPVKTENNILSTVLQLINRHFFAAKSWTLLTLLFGYGFAILINNISSKGKNPVLFFSWRMILLFVLAFINSSFWLGDILKDYAFLGLVLLLFYKSSAKVLGLLCTVLIVLTPVITAYIAGIKMQYTEITTNAEYLKLYYSGNWLDFFNFNLLASYYEQIVRLGYAVSAHIVMFACMLFGFLLQKIDFFNRLNELKKTLKYTLFISLFCAVTFGIIFNVALSYKAAFLTYFFPVYWVILSTMVFIATGICLLYNSGKLKTVFSYFSACGKMTLTNYIVQNILAAFIFSGIGLKIGNTMPYWFYFTVAVIVYVIQLFISKWWLSKFNYGPIEWAWRAASYRQLFPFRKTNDEAIAEIKAV